MPKQHRDITNGMPMEVTDSTVPSDTVFKTGEVNKTISSSVYVGLSKNGAGILFESKPVWNEQKGKYEKEIDETSQRVTDAEPIAYSSLALLAGLSNETDPSKVFEILGSGYLFKIDATFTRIK